MERFTFDVESTALTNEEHRAFATIVQNLVHLVDQHSVSGVLAGVTAPRAKTFCDGLQRSAQRMWKPQIHTSGTPE
jgi:hypothetical protein